MVSGRSGKTHECGEFQLGPGVNSGNLHAMAGEPCWFDAHAESDLVRVTLDSETIVDVLKEQAVVAAS